MAWAAWAIPLITSAISAISSKHNADKQEESTRDLRGQQLANMQQMGPWAKQFLGQGGGAASSAINYYQDLLSGNRSSAMQAMAPEINSLNSQNMGLVNAQQELSPRGGMNTAQASNLPWQNRGAVNNLLFSARPMAASQLGQMGTNMISQGLGAMGLGSGLTNSMLQYGLQARQQQFDQGQQIGAGLNGIYQNYLLSQMMGGQNNQNPSASMLPSPNQSQAGYQSLISGNNP